MILASSAAVTFGASGPLAKALMEVGWTPISAVAVRLTGGAVALAILTTFVRRGWLREAMRHRTTILFYGLIPVAGSQLCYYYAVAHLSVGVALLLEYLAPVLVVGWIWITTKRSPTALTFVGAVLAFMGTLLVLDVFSGARISTVGLVWALGAAICAACYYVMSDRATADRDGPHPLTLAAGGLVVGAAAVALLGLGRVLPMTFTTHDTVIAGYTTSFLVPILALCLVSTALAYTLGISAIARLRPSYASLVGLGEVISATAWAWHLLGEAITAAQAMGGVVVLIGLALASRSSDLRAVESTWPDTAIAKTFANPSSSSGDIKADVTTILEKNRRLRN